MYYYHMTALNNLSSIAAQGLIPQNGWNGKLIGDEKVKVFFSEGFEGVVALFVDFDIVFERIKSGQMKPSDKCVEKKVLQSKSLADYLGEGVYLRFDRTGIENEQNFENGCTDVTIPPEKIDVCILRQKDTGVILYSRFDVIKYMMKETRPENILYYGSDYEAAPDSAEATSRIQNKVRTYYANHRSEIDSYTHEKYELEFIGIRDFVSEFL